MQIIHGATFVLTLQAACCLSWIFCLVFGQSFNCDKYGRAKLWRHLAIGCDSVYVDSCGWIILKWLKQYWRARASETVVLGTSRVNYSSISTRSPDHSSAVPPQLTSSSSLLSPLDLNTAEESQSQREQPPQQILVVIALTLTGSLDELVSFPSFILAGTFSYAELAVGCLCACLVVLMVVTCFIRACQSLLDVLDRIPLYGILALYATILTLNYSLV